jgi:ubiquinone/menaquinone biosynthesis C-methylase UbiE
MESWISRQTEANTAQFEKLMEQYHPSSRLYTKDAVSFLRRITEECNYLEAVIKISPEKHLSLGTVMVDLAAGIGWLTAYMSKFDCVDKIYTLDTSKYCLENMLPEVITLMGGKGEKVQPIEGLFSPLLFKDESIDCVMVSSSLHHAENLEKVLVEIARVLKINGVLFILNETPHSYAGYAFQMIRSSLRIIKDSILKKYHGISSTISSSGLLHDPFLGDRAYPLWYWIAAIKKAGFSETKIIDTGSINLFAKKQQRLR